MPKESIHMKLGINAFCDDKKLPVKGFNSACFHNDKNGLPIDSTAPVREQTKNKKIEDVVKELFEHKIPFKLVWMADIELKEDGKSFYNVPSNYRDQKCQGRSDEAQH